MYGYSIHYSICLREWGRLPYCVCFRTKVGIYFCWKKRQTKYTIALLVIELVISSSFIGQKEKRINAHTHTLTRTLKTHIGRFFLFCHENVTRTHAILFFLFVCKNWECDSNVYEKENYTEKVDHTDTLPKEARAIRNKNV